MPRNSEPNYDNWLQDTAAYEEWAGIDDNYDDDEEKITEEDEFDRWRDDHNGAYDEMRALRGEN